MASPASGFPGQESPISAVELEASLLLGLKDIVKTRCNTPKKTIDVEIQANKTGGGDPVAGSRSPPRSGEVKGLPAPSNVKSENYHSNTRTERSAKQFSNSLEEEATQPRRRKRKIKNGAGACIRCYNKKLRCVRPSEDANEPCERCFWDGLASECTTQVDGGRYPSAKKGRATLKETQRSTRVYLPRTKIKDVLSTLAECKKKLGNFKSLASETMYFDALSLIQKAEEALKSSLEKDPTFSKKKESSTFSVSEPAQPKREKISGQFSHNQSAIGFVGREEHKENGSDSTTVTPLERQSMRAISAKIEPRSCFLKRKKVVKRASRACIRCRSRKVRCNQDSKAQFPCQRCISDGFAAECVAHVALPSKEQRRVLGDLIARDSATPKALADHRNRHQGIQCSRNARCLRPAKHPGHCRVNGARSRSGKNRSLSRSSSASSSSKMLQNEGATFPNADASQESTAPMPALGFHAENPEPDTIVSV